MMSPRAIAVTFVCIFMCVSKTVCAQTGSMRQNGWKITKIVDGDTFWATRDGKSKMKVRLIGVDAPESRNTFRKKISPFGKISKAYLIRLIAGKELTLEFDVDSLDQYGRTLAYAYLADGTFINDRIIRDGYGKVMTFPPNVKYVERFTASQQAARADKAGIWKE